MQSNITRILKDVFHLNGRFKLVAGFMVVGLGLVYATIFGWWFGLNNIMFGLD